MDGQKKLIIGYTTGVFDMFHVGHLNILRRAKELCDYLIVGVSTDELCLSYKKKKPIIPYEERKAIIEAIKYVDKVVPQINRDKYHAWEEIGFDVMFVGDDWKGSPLFSELEKRFAEVGVRIEYFPYTNGTSSSILRERLLNQND
ncbi:MAG: adenylyltransferase/cytidyltransferase family protein [Muribaculaceae bacterium]